MLSKSLHSLSIFLLILPCWLYADEIPEKEVKTKAGEVTVFLKGAQISSRSNVSLDKGVTIVRFTDLSPYIVAQSVQVRATGQLTVLSVNHQHNYLDKLGKSQALIGLESKLEEVDAAISLERTHLAILKEEMAFLQENRNVGGKNEQTTVGNLQQALNFYSERLTHFKLKEIERNKTLQELLKHRQDLQRQIGLAQGENTQASGEIVVRVDVAQAGTFPLELTYLVENAGWYPSYDIRAKNINEPVQLIYKANVKQDTKMDWTDVKLRFSTANPNASGVAPELQPYYLNYHTLPPVYGIRNNEVGGRVTGTDGRPIAGVHVSVGASTIATMTNENGQYALALPNHASSLTFAAIGYDSQTLPVYGSTLNVRLSEQVQYLEEVAVASALAGKAAGLQIAEASTIRGTGSNPLPVEQIAQQTTVEFAISMPYSIRSDNKNYTIDIDALSLPAHYQYLSIPKVEKDVFLLAHIVDWEKFNLLEGEANVFFEDTYVGKTVLDVRNVSDTLSISLGRDRNVLVTREKIRDLTTKRLLGNRKEDHRSWKITVRNTKSQEINMVVLDQVPVSTLSEIEVQLQKLSGGQHHAETGEIKWEFAVKPAGNVELDLQYTVKYPRNKTLVVE